MTKPLPYGTRQKTRFTTRKEIPGLTSPRRKNRSYNFSHLLNRGQEPPGSIFIFLTTQGAGVASQRILTAPL